MVVYFMQRESDNAIKIGYSNNIKHRYYSIRSDVSSKVEILCVIPGDRSIEQSIHKKFFDIRLKGEWFSADHSLLSYIDSLEKEKLDIDSLWSDENSIVMIPIKTSIRELLRKETQIKGETYDTIIQRLISDSARLKVLEQANEESQKSKSAFDEVIKT